VNLPPLSKRACQNELMLNEARSTNASAWKCIIEIARLPLLASAKTSRLYIPSARLCRLSPVVPSIPLTIPDKSPRATYLFWSFPHSLMSASSNAGSSSKPPAEMPAHRPTLHQPPPRALHHPTCRCPQCYLRATLFPRNNHGVIILPRPSDMGPQGLGDGARLISSLLLSH